MQEEHKEPFDGRLSVGKSGARELARLGDICVGAASYESAVDYFTRALDLLPSDNSPEDRAPLLRKVCYCLERLGRIDEIDGYIEEAEEVAHGLSDTVERARIQIEKGKLAIARGRLEAALHCAESARELLADSTAYKEKGFAENLLGHVLLRTGHAEDGKQCFLRALDLFKKAGDIRDLALSYNNLGLVFKNSCDWPRAIECLQVALNLQAVEGEYHGRAQQLQNLGVVHTKLSNWKLATESFEQCLQISREVSDPLRAVRALIGLGNVQRMMRQWTAAQASLEEARETLAVHHQVREEILVYEFLGALAFDRRDLATANQHYETAWNLANKFEAGEDLNCEIYRLRAELALTKGEAQRALSLIKSANACAKNIGDKFEEALSWRIMALAQAALGAKDDAAAGFRAGA
jgi:tetratricopeptide (TPR) repeat protein